MSRFTTNHRALLAACALALLASSCKLNPTIDPNEEPHAMAGADMEVAFSGAPVMVTLDGSLSSDRDGRIVRFIWRSVDPSITGLTMTPAITLSLGEGRWGFNLWVEDDDGAISDPDLVVVAVGVPLDGPLNGTPDMGMAGAPAPDPSEFMPDQACLDVNANMNEACRACTCTPMAMGGCSEAVMNCTGNADATYQMQCSALFNCAIENGCSGAACYTAAFCMAEIDTASGGDPVGGCDPTMPDSTACAGASAITACQTMNCAAACGL